MDQLGIKIGSSDWKSIDIGSSPIPKVFQLDMPDRFLSVERESDLPQTGSKTYLGSNGLLKEE